MSIRQKYTSAGFCTINLSKRWKSVFCLGEKEKGMLIQETMDYSVTHV